MDLFLDKLPELEREFRKSAAYIARLSEEPSNWGPEVNSELLRQLPYLSDYNVTISLDRVDAHKGVGFGYADITNKTERPTGEHADTGIAHIRIPIIIEDRALKPFSVFLDGERVCPVSEWRIREVLFNPTSFDISSSQPRDPSLVEAMMPPARTGVGLGGEYKMASDNTALLTKIAHTITKSDAEKFVKKVAADVTIQAGLTRSGIGDILVDAIDRSCQYESQDKLAHIASNIEPSVITIQKLPGDRFLVKSANVNAFAPGQEAQGQVVPQQEAEQAIGPENAQAMQPGQSATMVAEPIAPMSPPDAAPAQGKIVDTFGEWVVQDLNGNRLVGIAFPQILDWGGFQPVPMQLFTNGSAYAMQQAIAGEFSGMPAILPSEQPRGEGIFYSVVNGDARCTMPVTVGSTISDVDGSLKYVAFGQTGEQFVIAYSPSLQNPIAISQNEFVLPKSWKFMRLNNQTQLVAEPMQLTKVAMIKAARSTITMFYNGAFHLRGGCGLDKIASKFREDLDPVSAEFMLGLLGVDGREAKIKVSEARRKGKIKLSGLKTITTLGERYSDIKKTAAIRMQYIPNLRVDLTKEAAVLQDENTVDKLLALNFINPENLHMFLESIPDLEQCSEKLAEMLLFSYMGMRELPEGALERSIRNLEDVIKNLKALASTGLPALQ